MFDYTCPTLNAISISEGQDNFVKLVKSAEDGASHLITENDEAVAVMMPYNEYAELVERDQS